MLRIKKYLLLFPIAFGTVTASCGPSVGHEIIMEEKGMIMVNVDRKMNVEELKEFIGYYFDDYQHNNFMMVKVCVPSKYPDYPETPWAQVIIDGLNDSDDPITTVEIYGAMDETEEQNLASINPGMDGIKGKWYWHEPMMEGVYFLVENSTDTALYGYRARGYREENMAKWDGPEIIDRWDNPGPHIVYQLSAGTRSGQYCIVSDTLPFFWITEKNELIWNRVKTYKDTSRCMLLPLPL
jgi:hypothetical protein